MLPSERQLHSTYSSAKYWYDVYDAIFFLLISNLCCSSGFTQSQTSTYPDLLCDSRLKEPQNSDKNVNSRAYLNSELNTCVFPTHNFQNSRHVQIWEALLISARFNLFLQKHFCL